MPDTAETTASSEATRVFRLYEDVLPAHGAPVYLPGVERSIYLVEGTVTVEFDTGAQAVPQGSAWTGEHELTVLTGAEPARVWRWELQPAHRAGSGELRSAPHAESRLLLEREVSLDPDFTWLMRCDRVSFPPGGTAWTHMHQGPGIRCCLEGAITIETEGTTAVHRAGEAWFERGPSPVLAPTTTETSTTFIRCFLLPRALRGKSSLRYVLPEDAGKPKVQDYHVFCERVMAPGR
jgi:hypothetical protein